MTRDAVPPARILDDVLHWIWSWRLQVKRLKESFEREWADNNGIEGRKASSSFSFDEHILTVAGWNLVRALERAQPFLQIETVPQQQGDALRLLRHLYEHWDEQRSAFTSPDRPKDRSAAAFAAQFPNGRPWTMVFDKDDWILGGVVRLNEFTRALDAVEAAALAAEKGVKEPE